MNKNFWLKGFQVKAIVISLSLALPVVVMAQTYSDRRVNSTLEVPKYSYSIADFANAMRWRW
ncbi:hypothetical protein H6F42_20550 [Pseudanabaena sp. FACHB-1998]|uniref:hypothetical protein n=1 Tax=Pseudanabaena sp. FACHB-1998 TaxID=2692858 RepID=UPI001680DBAE|nr:hypothetical protein [Pseudanabaena sp. FACHB-1998]MBD2179318.1 hypothetical protein [Pseudanabaena sp. FACHB-1998]